MSRRRAHKERKRPFNLQEDLTINCREILKYLNKDIEEGIVSKVWTVDGVICFRPSGDSSVIERCTSLEDYHCTIYISLMLNDNIIYSFCTYWQIIFEFVIS